MSNKFRSSRKAFYKHDNKIDLGNPDGHFRINDSFYLERTIYYAFINNNDVFILEFSCPLDRYEECQPIFLKIADSVYFY
ncbi:hypothetical protein CJD36_002770 [Flavipsychrobacter stenotrophus]|uniref:Uncharacterized protein n=1 Tax=Flavipsychrobacter stenotrophus TaxID=2077091 RepID=A0A2S7T142_9BACT|nr:hypothetical protein CJD36_002770 [Flavipsychrobacter stenotrophus]